MGPRKHFVFAKKMKFHPLGRSPSMSGNANLWFFWSTLTLALAAFCSASKAAEMSIAQVEFDKGFLSGHEGEKLDISRFEMGNAVPPGRYRVDVFVNENRVARDDIEFKVAGGSANAVPCFDAPLLLRLGVAMGRLPQPGQEGMSEEGACRPLGEVVEGASSSFDFSAQRLDVSMPQIALARSARGYVSPEYWQEGVTSGTLGYNFNLYSSGRSGFADRQTAGYLGMNGGINVGLWRFRHDGSFSFDSQGGRRYQSISSYAQRDITAWHSQLTLGEAYTSGELFDSVRFRGIRLATDDRMLPDSLRGYAPTVRGVANSNARIVIRQSGMILYETTVAPGAFEINDLYPTGYGGDLEVSVEEADGSVRSFSVPFAVVPLSLRPGVDRYSMVAGVLRDPQLSSKPLFGQGTWQRGFTNLITGYAGLTAAPDYAAGMAGAAFNTSYGAVGADLTRSNTRMASGANVAGSSFRLSYAKDIPATNTNVAIAAYRYSTGGYFGLSDAMLARESAERNPVSVIVRQRSRASITMGQQLGAGWGRFSASASAVNYWNREGSDLNYWLGYNNSYRGMGYGLSVSRSRSATGQIGTVYYASLSIPLGRERPLSLTANLSRDNRGAVQAQSTLSGSSADSQVSYSLTANHASGSGSGASNGGSVNAAYRGRYAELTGSAGAGTGYSQMSFGLRGAVVAHGGGITLSQPISDTIGLVQADGAEGARLLNATGVRVDRQGYAVVPYLMPYSLNTIELDPKGLPMDVELKVSSLQVAPRAGAVTLLKFDTITGRAALIHAKRLDGSSLPFGARVLDEGGEEVGVVGQASRIFVRGLNEHGRLTVVWDSELSASCVIPYDFSLVRKDGSRSADLDEIETACAPA